MSIVDSGWLYYAFLNPATGNDEPKASYVKRIDWDGNPAVIGAGIYPPRHSRHLRERRGQRQGTRGRAFQREAAGVCPLRRHGA